VVGSPGFKTPRNWQDDMAKYLYECRYTADGAKCIAREGGSTRRAAVEKMWEGLGGKVEAFYDASLRGC
jgi:uncharacterized protein with GYD domain